MAVLFGKADDLGLDTGAVTRADAGDGAIVHGASVEILANDLVGTLVGIG